MALKMHPYNYLKWYFAWWPAILSALFFHRYQNLLFRCLSTPNLKKKDEILPLAKRLPQQVDYSSIHPIRLIGLSVSNATSEEARMEDKENSTQKPEYKELELEFKDWER